MPIEFEMLQRGFAGARRTRPVGRVTGIAGGLVQVAGLAETAQIGDPVLLRRAGRELAGEVLCISGGSVGVLPGGPSDGLAVDDRAILDRHPPFAPAAHWIGRVIDPFGRPLDGRPLLPGTVAADLHRAPPPAAQRQPLGARLDTGLAVMNTLLPLAEGQRLGLFAGSGIGKSQLLAQLARRVTADVVVLALIGERGREVNQFVSRVLGPEGMRRTVVVAATSDQSALTRRRCAWAAMSVAEHFRDAGQSVLLLADSMTRFAEAHREIAVATGEAPALRGFPASVAPRLTALCERAGPGAAGQGQITALFSVLVAGADMDEPIADILRGVLDGHVVLSREIAERGRFPAIDVARSVSRCLPEAAAPAENAALAEARRLLGAYERAEVMIKAGLYAEGSDPLLDQAVRIWPELDAFFAREEPGGLSDSFDRLDLLLRRSKGAAERRHGDGGA